MTDHIADRVTAITHRLLATGNSNAAYVAAIEVIATLTEERDSAQLAAEHYQTERDLWLRLCYAIWAPSAHR